MAETLPTAGAVYGSRIIKFRRNPNQTFEVGDLAMYKRRSWQKGKVRKLQCIWEGPYQIVSIDEDTGNCTL